MKNRNIVSWSYFVIHLLLEFVCFSNLYAFFNNNGIAWVIALLYDAIAFVPQGVIGSWFNAHKKMDLGSIGFILMSCGVFLINKNALLGLIFIASGNAFIHEAGAISTTYVSDGTLSPGAIYVSGGSFGLVIGRYMGSHGYTLWMGIVAMILIEGLVLFSNKYWMKEDLVCPKFDLIKEGVKPYDVIWIAFMVVTCRSFIGYAIPISWKKEVWQTFVLFFVMGLGKMLGGILSDKFGARKIGMAGTLLCIPFLILGKNIMVISVIGIFMFSLTMSITFGMLLSVIKDDPGFAFGITTLGLFAGLIPLFIFGSFNVIINIVLVIVLSLSCTYGLYQTLK